MSSSTAKWLQTPTQAFSAILKFRRLEENVRAYDQLVFRKIRHLAEHGIRQWELCLTDDQKIEEHELAAEFALLNISSQNKYLKLREMWMHTGHDIALKTFEYIQKEIRDMINYHKQNEGGPVSNEVSPQSSILSEQVKNNLYRMINRASTIHLAGVSNIQNSQSLKEAISINVLTTSTSKAANNNLNAKNSMRIVDLINECDKMIQRESTLVKLSAAKGQIYQKLIAIAKDCFFSCPLKSPKIEKLLLIAFLQVLNEFIKTVQEMDVNLKIVESRIFADIINYLEFGVEFPTVSQYHVQVSCFNQIAKMSFENNCKHIVNWMSVQLDTVAKTDDRIAKIFCESNQEQRKHEKWDPKGVIVTVAESSKLG